MRWATKVTGSTPAGPLALALGCGCTQHAGLETPRPMSTETPADRLRAWFRDEGPSVGGDPQASEARRKMASDIRAVLDDLDTLRQDKAELRESNSRLRTHISKQETEHLHVLAEMDELRAMLKRLEWSGWTVQNEVAPMLCPACGNHRQDRHATDCELARLLR